MQLTAGLNGSTVDGDTVLVTGSAITPPNSAVTVNGQLASLTANGQFFINDLPLAAGANTVTATVTAPDGQTASQVITLNRSTTPPLYNLSVGAGGIVIPGTPIDVDVTILNARNTTEILFTDPQISGIAIQCEYPGPAATVLELGTYACTYTAPGTYEVKVTVKDPANVAIYTGTKGVTIKGPTDNIAAARAVYDQLMSRLKAGNEATALNLFAGHAKALHKNHRGHSLLLALVGTQNKTPPKRGLWILVTGLDVQAFLRRTKPRPSRPIPSIASVPGSGTEVAVKSA